jgi:hypothetical protein
LRSFTRSSTSVSTIFRPNVPMGVSTSEIQVFGSISTLDPIMYIVFAPVSIVLIRLSVRTVRDTAQSAWSKG